MGEGKELRRAAVAGDWKQGRMDLPTQRREEQAWTSSG